MAIPEKNEYDIIIVGGGHNGLTCGCYLARAGQKVLVLERRHNIGGGACTEEVTLPGFKHNLHSSVHSWVHYGPAEKDLELHKYGYRFIETDPGMGIIFEDGSSILTYKDVEKTAKQLEKFSRKDARTYREVAGKFVGVMELILASWFSPPAPLSQLYAPLETTKEGMELVRYIVSSPEDIIDELFEHEKIKTYLLHSPLGGGVDPTYYGMGGMMPVLFSVPHSKGWTIPVGGSRAIAEALFKSLEAKGGEILKNTHVKKIIVEGGTATGVELEDGAIVTAKKAVISGTHIVPAALELIGEEHLEEDFVAKAKHFKHDVIPAFSPHLALNEAVQWKAARDNPDIQKCPVIAFGFETTADIRKYVYDIGEGTLPSPGGHIVLSTIYDSTQAPPGKHTAVIWQYAPYKKKNGKALKWDELKENYGKQVIGKVSGYANNLTGDNILGQYLYSPLDVERDQKGMPEGGFVLGEPCPSQLGIFRPFAGWAHYRMPIKNFYLANASAHPQGGITCAAGYNAAGIIAEDLGLKKWWE